MWLFILVIEDDLLTPIEFSTFHFLPYQSMLPSLAGMAVIFTQRPTITRLTNGTKNIGRI